MGGNLLLSNCTCTRCAYILCVSMSNVSTYLRAANLAEGTQNLVITSRELALALFDCRRTFNIKIFTTLSYDLLIKQPSVTGDSEHSSVVGQRLPSTIVTQQICFYTGFAR